MAESDQTLCESEERYRLLVELSPDAILLESEGELIFANAAAQRLFRAQQSNDLLKCSMLSLIVPAQRDLIAVQMEGLEQGATYGETEEQALLLDGAIADVAITRTKCTYCGKPAIYIVVRGISERKRFETELQFRATHDALTSLPNRSLFVDRMRQMIAYAKRHNGRFVVCFIDLDNFKWVNDNLGHETGDELLKLSARRMLMCVRGADTVARMGGDEFVLLLQDAHEVGDAARVICRVAECVAQPMQLGKNEVKITCSIGCSTYPEDGGDADTLLKYADAAMYWAKETGRNNVQFYNAALRNHLEERLKLECDLKGAIERNELFLCYQPQIDLRSGAISGIEALVRWKHPEFGMLDPSRFIRLAEETGLMESIGEWILLQACKQNKAWQDAGLTPVRMAVNISGKQLLRAGLEAQVARCLHLSGLDPVWLELELTESTLMEDPNNTIPLLLKLKSMHVSLSIDDFGTGYSNMRYLARLPIDGLKLDGSFVQHITADPAYFAMVEAMIVMAHRLNLTVVAEMAETKGQVLRLISSGCDDIQGFYFSEPLPSEACREVLRTGKVALPEQLSSLHAEPSLLILDDEQNVTFALRRTLQSENYVILLANTVDEAFELLACNQVSVVISDFAMPKFNGLEFLHRVRSMYPHIIRLMLSAYRDFNIVNNHPNSRSAVHQFLTKPWDNQQLREVVAAAFARAKANQDRTISTVNTV